MQIARSLVFAICCLAAAAGVSAQTRDADIEVGFVASNDGNAFLYTTEGHLLPASTILLQYLAINGSVACCVRVDGSALGAPIGSTAPVSDALFGRPMFRYRLKPLPAALKRGPFVGAAIIGHASVRAESTSAGMIIHVSSAAATSASTVQVCLASEGSNLFLIAGDKLKTQIYYRFGYDVKATCDPTLFALPVEH